MHITILVWPKGTALFNRADCLPLDIHFNSVRAVELLVCLDAQCSHDGVGLDR